MNFKQFLQENKVIDLTDMPYNEFEHNVKYYRTQYNGFELNGKNLEDWLTECRLHLNRKFNELEKEIEKTYKSLAADTSIHYYPKEELFVLIIALQVINIHNPAQQNEIKRCYAMDKNKKWNDNYKLPSNFIAKSFLLV